MLFVSTCRCFLCCKFLVDPVLLPECRHSVCQRCVVKLHGRTFAQCPKCGRHSLRSALQRDIETATLIDRKERLCSYGVSFDCAHDKYVKVRTITIREINVSAIHSARI